MRSKLLVSTAALVAGLAVASAQNMPGGGGPSGGGQSGAGGQDRQQSQSQQDRGGQAQQGARDQDRSQRGEGQGRQEQTTGQGQRDQGRQGQRDQGKESAQGKDNPQGKDNLGKDKQGKQGQSQQRDQSTGQAQREQGKEGKQGQSQQRDQSKQGQTQQRDQSKQGQSKQPDQTTGQAPQRDQRQQSQSKQPDQTTGQAPQRDQRQQSQPQQGQPQPGQAQQGQTSGSVTLSAEQRTRIQQTVLAGRNVPRVNNVNFAISVGTVVPSHVTIIDVPDTLIEINPAWRGHRFFVVRDEIIVVDSGRRILATVPVGSSSGARLDRGGAQGAVALSVEEIRQVQIVLKEKGFFVGEPDGKFGPSTRQALIAFQRQQGFQASGRIDVQTKTALQISGTSGQQGSQQGNQGGSQPSTTGQGGDRMQQPSANQGMGAGQQQQGNQSGNQPSTTGQSPANQELGAGQRDNQSGNQPSTTGQGGNRPEQANPDSPAPGPRSGSPSSGGQAR